MASSLCTTLTFVNAWICSFQRSYPCPFRSYPCPLAISTAKSLFITLDGFSAIDLKFYSLRSSPHRRSTEPAILEVGGKTMNFAELLNSQSVPSMPEVENKKAAISGKKRAVGLPSPRPKRGRAVPRPSQIMLLEAYCPTLSYAEVKCRL